MLRSHQFPIAATLSLGLLAVSLTANTANAVATAFFEQESILDTDADNVHEGNIQAAVGDILEGAGVSLTGSDQGWPAIDNVIGTEFLNDGITNVLGGSPRFIGGEPTSPVGNFVEYDLGGTFDIGSVAILGSWTDRTGQAWELSFSTDGGTTFDNIFTLNGLDDDGFVSGFTNSVVNRVTVFDDQFGLLGTGVTDIRVDFLEDDINWNVYREIDVLTTSIDASALGDFDDDDDVDLIEDNVAPNDGQSDFDILAANFFNDDDPTFAQGDVIDDGIVDFADFRVWKTAFNAANNATAAAVVSAAAVPEPTSLVLLALCGVGSLASCRRGRC